MFNFFVTHLKETSEIAGYLAAIFGFAFGFYKWVIKPIIKHFKSIAELSRKTEKIYKEITPNGGSSIKDVIRRLDQRTISIEEKLNIMQGIQDAFREDGPIGIFECSVNGENFYVNRTYAKWLGCSKSDLIGFGWRNFLSDFSKKDEYDEEWQQAFLEGREVRFPISFRGLDKKKFFCDVRAYPIKDANGNVTNYLGILSREEEEDGLINNSQVQTNFIE